MWFGVEKSETIVSRICPRGAPGGMTMMAAARPASIRWRRRVRPPSWDGRRFTRETVGQEIENVYDELRPTGDSSNSIVVSSGTRVVRIAREKLRFIALRSLVRDVVNLDVFCENIQFNLRLVFQQLTLSKLRTRYPHGHLRDFQIPVVSYMNNSRFSSKNKYTDFLCFFKTFFRADKKCRPNT